MAKVVVSMRQGRITVPAGTRQELGLDEAAEFQAEVRNGRLVLTPAAVVPRGDAWAYSREHRLRVKRALRDVEAGRVRRLAEEDLDRPAGK